MKGANPDAGRGRRGREDSDDSAASDEGVGWDEEAMASADGSASSGAAAMRGYAESWVHMLALIRGVSEEKAAVISRHFPSVRHLMAAYGRMREAAEAERLLAELQCGQRKIGEADQQTGVPNALYLGHDG